MTGALVQCGAIGTFMVLGALYARRPAQGFVTRDTLINLANGALLFAFRAGVIAGVVGWLEVGLVDASLVSAPAVQFALAFLMLDFSRYWLHRAHHRVEWLWMFHRVHHMSERLDSTSGLRMHIVDFIQLAFLPVLLFGALLNTSQWAPWTIVAALSVGGVFDAFQHANLRWNPDTRFGRIWGLAFNNPHFHAWHHTRDGADCDGNYGNTLVIWDRMFGSDVTQDHLPEAFGLEPDQAIENSLVAMQLLQRRVS